MPMNTSGFSELLDVSIRRMFLQAGKERPLEFPLVFNVMDMEYQNEKDSEVSGLGTMPEKQEGSQFGLDETIVGNTKTWTATPYGTAIEITFEMWYDDRFGVMGEMAREMGRTSRNRMEVNAWSVLNNAFDTSFTGFESSVSLCSTSHTLLNGDTVANRPTVDIGLSVTGIQDGIKNFENLTNHRGLPRLMAPTMLVIDPENRYKAREILGSNRAPFTADNEINALVADDLRVVISHYLTTSTYWFLLAAKGEHDLNFKWLNKPILDSFDDPRTKNAVFTAYQRHAHGFANWEGVYGSTG